MKKDSIPYVVGFTFAVCAAFIVPLSVANEFAKPATEANAKYAAHLAVLKAFDLADSSTPRSEVERTYSETVVELPGGEKAYSALIDGETFYAVQATGPGLWGSITLVAAADEATERLKGLEILSQSETPGLGGRIDEAWFKEQFKGERIGPSGVALNPKGTGRGDPDGENGLVDGVTGASRTSGFVLGIVNGALDSLKKLGGRK
jgi:Na+-transporting NADH:ubiquinone oxidoreductase subunit C